ncbi:hypothetical protein AB0B50_32855 [Streptomyces sp. NPDC041068]|uniref:hypothetical protein n=1 Tax=Streptomyces sp. NPDC041068 TaxID=3155130 RepID=UPI003400FAB9
MTKLLLSVHVLVAILAVGSITVAASMFPRYAQRALGGEGSVEGEKAQAGDAEPRGGRAADIAALLHRICRGYALAGLAVPVFGIATGAQLGVLTDAWLVASLLLTTIAAVLLAAAILPGQRGLLELADGTGGTRVDGTGGTPVDGTGGTPVDGTGGTPVDGTGGTPVDGTGGTPVDGGKSAAEAARPAVARLHMLTGIFNVLWATVTVLMIVRPGSTTGA